MRISKIWKCLLAVVIVVLLNEAMKFVLSPNYGSARITFQELKELEEVDTVIVGSSLAEMNIDPNRLEEQLGVSVYNAGTAGQSPESTYLLVKYLVEYKHPSRIIYALNYSSLGDFQSVASQIAFHDAYKAVVPVWDDIQSDIQFFTTRNHAKKAEALAYYFPWSVNHTFLRPSEIIANGIEKLNGVKPSDSLNMHSPTSKYYGKGFQAYDTVVDYNAVGKATSIGYFNEDFYSPTFTVLDQIITLCKENQVELFVVNPPKPAFDVISYGDWYYEKKNTLETFFGDRGVTYVDFSFAKPELFESKEEYFRDYDHLNYEGTQPFSISLAKYLHNPSSDFFFTKEEYLKSIDWISSVDFDMEETQDGVIVQANAWTGHPEEVEYRYSYRVEGMEDYILDSDFVMDKKHQFILEEGRYEIRVEARIKGSEQIRFLIQGIRLLH